MPEKRIEYDLRGTALRGDSRVLDPEDFGRQDDAAVAGAGVRFGAQRAHRPGDCFDTFGEPRLLGPVPVQHEMLDRSLPKMIELAHGQKESCREPCRVDLRKGERRFAQATELRAQLLLIEDARGRGGERRLALHGDTVAFRDEDELERPA